MPIYFNKTNAECSICIGPPALIILGWFLLPPLLRNNRQCDKIIKINLSVVVEKDVLDLVVDVKLKMVLKLGFGVVVGFLVMKLQIILIHLELLFQIVLQ